MAISTKIDRMTASIDRAGDSIARLNNEISRAASTEFTEAPRILAPASFSPLPPSPPGTPTNPLPGDPFAPPRGILGPDGNPARRTSTGGGNTSGTKFKLADNPLIPSLSPGGPTLTRSEIEGFAALGVCHRMDLPSGGWVWSCPSINGMYPGTDGVLSTTSGRSSGGSQGAPGRSSASSDIVGLADPVFSSGAARGGRRGGGGTAGGGGTGSATGSATGASTTSAPLAVDIDSRPITDRLDGLRSDIRELSRSLAGDGGAGIRFKGGL